MENKEKLVNKVRKLLAMANDNRGNENEAYAAMLKAQELMAENGISMGEISDAPTQSKHAVEGDAENYSKTPWYCGAIAGIVAENFRCYCMKRLWNKKAKMVFVGLETDVELAKEVYWYAKQQIEYGMGKARNKFLEDCGYDIKGSNAYANDYARGFLAGLQKGFKEQVEKHAQEWGLVLVKDDAVVKYWGGLSLRKSKGNNTISSSGSGEAYATGFSDGKSFKSANGQIAQ